MEKLLQFGCCSHCDKQVMDLKQKDPKKRKLENYRENWFELSDGSLMKVAVCKDCDSKMKKSTADNIMKRHYLAWTQQIEEDLGWDREKKDRAIANHLAKKLQAFSINHEGDIINREKKKDDFSKKDKLDKEKFEKENLKKVEENLSNII